jgi:hypothetical protein
MARRFAREGDTMTRPIETIIRKNPKFSKQIEDQLRRADALKQVREQVAPLNPERNPPRRSKMNAVRTTTATGETFDSKHEARIVTKLRAAYGHKNIVCQVSIPLEDVASGQKKARIRVDVLRIIERFDDGSFRAELLDPKGRETEKSKRNRQWLRDKHGIEVKTL